MINTCKETIELCNVKKPLVSWILCAHVGNEELRIAIKSCIEQTFTDYEIIIIINGCYIDDIIKKIMQWFGDNNNIYIYKTDVQHLSFSLAIGLHYAKGEFIARMDSDDISTPDRLELQVEYMINNPDIIVLGTCYELIDYKGHPIKKISLPLYNNDIRRTFIIGNPICHPSVMFRRKEIIDIGGYLGDIYAQDYDLWARLAMNKKYKFANLKKICLQYRVQGSGNARKSRLAYASMAGAQFRNFIYGAGISWFVGALISAFKAVIVSKK